MYSIDGLTRALIKDGRSVSVSKNRDPQADRSELGPNDVVVRVAFAGICRTDLYAAEGRLPEMASRVVLGHEGSGVVVAIGKGVTAGGIALGDPVTILPRVACAECKDPLTCDRAAKLGVDRDGVFAEVVRLPLSSVRRVPTSMPLKVAAYVEPVAAALAIKPWLVLNKDKGQRVLIYGQNRIAELTRRIIGCVDPSAEVTVVAASSTSAAPPKSAFDVAIETVATSDMLRTLIGAVRREGTILLKSRPVEPIALDVSAAVEKEITLRAVRYASFNDAIDLLASKTLDIADLLLDETFPLERWEEAFAAARSESKKPFFAFAAFALEPRAKTGHD